MSSFQKSTLFSVSNQVKLTERLTACTGFIKNGGTLADIGTDHALLPAYLVQNGTVERAIASDVRQGPLMNAAETLRRFSLSEKIELRLSDGLDAFSPGDAQQFVFAGMGGTLIAELLARAPWLKDGSINLVFQPQSRAEELREYLYKNGFTIIGETAVSEGRRVYIALSAVFDGLTREASPEACFLGELAKCKTDDARRFFTKEYSRIKKKYDGVIMSSATDSSEEVRLKRILDAIGGVI